MIIYWIGCALTMFITHCCLKTRNYKKGRVIILSLISGFPLFLLAAFRFEIGTDYAEYANMFKYYYSYNIRAGIEPIFFYINRFVHVMNLNVQWVFVICSMIYISIIFYYLLKKSVDPVFSVFLLVGLTFYLSSFNTMRQHVACAILLLSLFFIEQKKLKIFLFLVLLAIGFHYSSFVFIPIYFLVNVKINPKKVLIYTSIILILRGPIINFIYYILESTKYVKYLDAESAGNMGNMFGILIQIAILLFASYTYREDREYNIYYWVQVIATWLNILGASISMVQRVKWIFAIPSIILIPLALKNIKSAKNRIIIKCLIVICIVIYATIVIDFMGSYGVVPYKSIF